MLLGAFLITVLIPSVASNKISMNLWWVQQNFLLAIFFDFSKNFHLFAMLASFLLVLIFHWSSPSFLPKDLFRKRLISPKYSFTLIYSHLCPSWLVRFAWTAGFADISIEFIFNRIIFIFFITPLHLWARTLFQTEKYHSLQKGKRLIVEMTNSEWAHFI